MKKIIYLLLVSSLSLLFLSGCSYEKTSSENDSELTIYTSIYPMYDFTTKIVGDKATVVNMIPAGMEPHDWEPSAADIIGLEKADVFIYNGLNMEHWVFDVLNSLENKDLIIVEASKGTTLLEGGHVHTEEDEHEDHDEELAGIYDPHVWLNPMNAKIEMKNIMDGLILADPKNKDYYNANYAKYAIELDLLDEEFTSTLSSQTNRNIIVAHEAFGYLCKAYGLNQVAIDGLSPDSEPNPARMAEIIAFGKEESIKVIFFEELVSPKVAETIADAIGAKTDILNPLEGLSEEQISQGEDYFSIMRQNLEAIKAALEDN